MKIKQPLARVEVTFGWGAVATASDSGTASLQLKTQSVDYFGDRLSDPPTDRVRCTALFLGGEAIAPEEDEIRLVGA